MKFIKLFFVCFLLLVGCSADFDTFGTSDYNELKDIKFVEQEMGTTIYGDEHLIKITLEAPPESDSTWDSVTIEWISISNMASAHLVESKFKAFPSDADERDSLAKTLAYGKKALKKGDKIRLPASLVVYLMVVSESEIPSLWKVEFSIPGVEPTSESSAHENGNGDSKGESNSSSSAGEGDNPESSSSVQMNANNSLTIKFKNEVENVVVGDTIFVTFAQGTDFSKVELDTAFVHRKATIDKEPSSIKDWSKVQKFTVTAENGEKKDWYVVVRAIQNSETDLMLYFENGFLDSKTEKTLAMKLAYGSSIATARLGANGVSLSPGATIAPKPDTISVWKASQDFVVTAEDGSTKKWTVTLAIAEEGEKPSSEKELVSISAAGQIEAATINASQKTVVLHLANAAALSAVQLTVAVSEKASHNFSSATIDLRQPRELVIHAQDMTSVTWTVSADYPLSAEADIEGFETEDFSSVVQIDKTNRKISVSVPFGTDLSEVYFSATVSEGASITSPKYGYLDLSSKTAEIVVAAANGSTKAWTVTATESVPAPQIKSISIGSGKVAGTIDQSKGTIFFNMDYKTDLNLRSLAVRTLTLSDGASTSDVAQGSSYDFAMPKTVTVSNSAGEKKVYTLQAGYQYLNSNFNTWKKDEFGNFNDVEGWDNGNNSYANTLTSSQEGQTVIKMESQNAVVKFASGNMLIAKFNPKNVADGNMAGYKDGNELIDFGKPFYGRPKYVEFDVKYDGKGDSCDLYLMLESRLDKDGNVRTSNNGSNVNRTSTDVNTLVASAWYRATTVTSSEDPDVVSITDASRSGYKTIRLAIHYGTPLTGSPIYASRAFATDMKNNDGVDNHVVATTTPDQFPVTHIRVVMASSALGNIYEGVIGATLYVDEMRLIY